MEQQISVTINITPQRDSFTKMEYKDKVFIDIGSWIGTTSMYGCRKSKHVYSIEADNLSIKDLSLNLSNNCINNNYTVINKAVFSKDNATINFGKNMFMKESRMNDSTSQIHNKNLDYSIQVKTITIDSILNNHNIKPSSISLIKVDIEGGEENILNDLYYLYKSHKVPIYISMHYEWWKDNNLNRFSFLTQKNKDYIKNNPFTDLLFTGSDIEIHTKKNKLNNIKNNKFLLSVKNLFKQLVAKTK